MARPLDLLSGKFDNAVLTTFSINLHFFERRVLPLLRQMDVSNIVLLADHAQLGQALAVPGVSQAGRAYNIASMKLGPGAFHPKVILLTNKESARVCISSANLTVDGQLRNTESFAAFDLSLAEHLTPITETFDLIRRLAADVPSHVAEALLAALTTEVPAQLPPSPFHVVHNLDQPLAQQIPATALDVLTAYVDNGRAINELGEGRDLRIYVDGSNFAAGDAFFGIARSVTPLHFKGRSHAKAYWTRDGTWAMVGSPNLSAAALLSTASESNTEVAVTFDPLQTHISLPPHSEWDGEPISTLAPQRLAMRAAAEKTDLPGSFDSWEEGAFIRVSLRMPEGILVEHETDLGWIKLGSVSSGVLQADSSWRPYRLRALVGGRLLYSVVQRIAELRIRRARRGTSRAGEVVKEPPLDLEGVRLLEGVLADLFALDELAEGERPTRKGAVTANDPNPQTPGLSEWQPARAHDEPRIPDVYMRVWKNSPDALLELVRKALRLRQDDLLADLEMLQERIDLLDLDAADEERHDTPAKPEGEPSAPTKVVERYRKAFVDLLTRGVDFVRRASNGDLADLGFQVILQLHEQLATLRLTVGEKPEPLVHSNQLKRQKLTLLDVYLRQRHGEDPLCLSTAAYHLTECLRATGWTAAEWELLESMAFEYSSVLVAQNLGRDLDEGSQITPEVVRAWLDDYARRSDWDRVIAESTLPLRNVATGSGLLNWIAGSGKFKKQTDSPAWRVVARVAVAGFREDLPFGALVRNDDLDSNFSIHCIVVDKKSKTLYSAARRRSDGGWVPRVFQPISMAMIEAMDRRGGDSINEHAQRVPLNATLGEATKGLIPSLVASAEAHLVIQV